MKSLSWIASAIEMNHSMSTVLFKSCPRCSGDRVLEHDFYGWYIACLACGHVSYPEISAEAGLAARKKHKQTA